MEFNSVHLVENKNHSIVSILKRLDSHKTVAIRASKVESNMNTQTFRQTSAVEKIYIDQYICYCRFIVNTLLLL